MFIKIRRDRKVGGKHMQWVENSYKYVHINILMIIVTLNVNGLNALIKRQILSEWIKK